MLSADRQPADQATALAEASAPGIAPDREAAKSALRVPVLRAFDAWKKRHPEERLHVSQRLPADLAQGMRAGDHEVFRSLASLWEVAIKHSISLAGGQRKLDWSAADLLTWAEGAGISLLPIGPAHCVQADKLPYRINCKIGRAHADQFDRMLVAQALTEPMRLVTSDPLVALHGIDAPGLIEIISA